MRIRENTVQIIKIYSHFSQFCLLQCNIQFQWFHFEFALLSLEVTQLLCPSLRSGDEIILNAKTMHYNHNTRYTSCFQKAFGVPLNLILHFVTPYIYATYSSRKQRRNSNYDLTCHFLGLHPYNTKQLRNMRKASLNCFSTRHIQRWSYRSVTGQWSIQGPCRCLCLTHSQEELPTCMPSSAKKWFTTIAGGIQTSLKSYGDRSFCLWRGFRMVSLHIRHSPSVVIFKTNLKTCLFLQNSKHYNWKLLRIL